MATLLLQLEGAQLWPLENIKGGGGGAKLIIGKVWSYIITV